MIETPDDDARERNAPGHRRVGSDVRLDFYSSAFCDPCRATRAVVDEVRRLVPTAVVEEHEITRDLDRAERVGIRSTPTIVIYGEGDTEVFRAEGVPTVNQVLTALAHAR